VEKSVEVEEDVGVEVVDDIDGEDACRFFVLFNVAEGVTLEGTEAVDGLLVVVVGKHLLHEAFDLQLLLLHHLVDDLLHPRKVCIHVAAALALHVLSPVQEIVFFLEFCPQLLAPLGQDTQNGWTFDRHVHARNLRFAVLTHVLRYLATNSIGSISLHPSPILVFLDLPSQIVLIIALRGLAVHPLPTF
jgi:hypothetical protein